MEWLAGLFMHTGVDVVRQCRGFTERKLCGRWARLPRLCIHYQRAVSRGPYSDLAWHREGRIDHDRSSLIALDRERLQQRIRCRPCRPDQSFGVDLFLWMQDHRTAPGIGYARVQLEDHPTGGHAFQRIGGKFFAELWQNTVPRVYQNDTDFLRRNTGIAGKHATGEIIERACQLCPGKAAAGHHKR